MTTREEIKAATEQVTKKLIDEGKLIEAGFAAYLIVVWGPGAIDNMPAEQLGALKKCYFSGAQHLFGTINSVLDPDDEPTEADLVVMDKIAAELDAWYAIMARDHMPTKGSA